MTTLIVAGRDRRVFGVRQPSTFTARATTTPSVSSARTDWMPMTSFVRCVSGSVSVGLNAMALVSDR